MRAAAVILALALAGCAQVPQAPPAASTEARLSGRLSVTVAGTVHNRGSGGAASFELIGDAQAGRLDLTSPLGTLVARASWQPGLVSLQTPDGERRFDDLDALTREMLGETVPVAALFDWLNARPWPAAPHQKTANGFEQLGWRIEPKLPALVATRLADPVVTLRARLDGGDEGTP
ncbi:outer membrane lipoprotein LolB [Roseateles sp. LYH14W]|uniref:Outer-membrane lipoprotein LolB n=1 Tax=Pelomonas parva TaxID=3299032 RepID=A0ABW7F4A8_9BURK